MAIGILGQYSRDSRQEHLNPYLKDKAGAIVCRCCLGLHFEGCLTKSWAQFLSRRHANVRSSCSATCVQITAFFWVCSTRAEWSWLFTITHASSLVQQQIHYTVGLLFLLLGTIFLSFISANRPTSVIQNTVNALLVTLVAPDRISPLLTE